MKRACLLALTVTLAACGQESAAGDGVSAKFYFSAIPDQGATELAEKFGKIAKYLSAELGVPVEYRASSDYGATVEMFKNGDVHLAWFGGLSGCQVRAAISGARAIAQRRKDTKFISYFISHRESRIEPTEASPRELAWGRSVVGPGSAFTR